MTDYTIREMSVDDIDGVMEVEKQSYNTQWPRGIFFQEVAFNDHAHYFVLEIKGDIIGFVGIWVIMDEAQITNIAIKPSYRGKKLGEDLFGYALKKAMQLGCSTLSLEVRTSNLVAQRMYRKYGLEPRGIRKGYYTDNKEDAIVMQVNLL